MTNEAAERMRRWLGETGITGELELFDEALATERKATVERIRAELAKAAYKLDDRRYGPRILEVSEWEALLDAEAEHQHQWITAALDIGKGEERYQHYCSVCHAVQP